ncbi:MAG: triose-phosphate isomerase [Proteobacteria bacterium]|nr:triose-phosphate isomerase [Pseudomonadota bacterium]MBU1709878.1 triose-phosphate isomerase [Pseudomonadota bacterium]
MTRYVLANWKSHKTLSEAEAWLEKFSQLYLPHPEVEVILAPPALYLLALRQKLQKYKIAHMTLAAQDLSPFPLGAYTGAIAAEMLRNRVAFALLGHSERRRYFHETDQDVANKVSEAQSANIRPIVCVDLPYARSQVAALYDGLGDLLIGYGPVEAMGIGIPQSPAKTRAAIEGIQQVAPGTPVLYGGSVNKDNAGDYLRIAGVAGLMVGTASLDPEEFALICKTASLI